LPFAVPVKSVFVGPLPKQKSLWAFIEGFLSINLGEVEEKGTFKRVFGY